MNVTTGCSRRLRRIFDRLSGRSLIVPVDDGLIFGPTAGLLSMPAALDEILAGEPNGLLAFPGIYRRYGDRLDPAGWIVNVSASTQLSEHTRKTLVGTVEDALGLGADCVAAHVNVTSQNEREMLHALGLVATTCRLLHVPLLAIMYPRREGIDGDDNYYDMKAADPRAFARLVQHSVRVGMELGADVIKTQYTGTRDTFARVVEAAQPVPIVTAGGRLQSTVAALGCAEDAIAAGARGISFGRNVFSRRDRTAMIRALGAIVHRNATAADALKEFAPTDELVEPQA